MDDKSAHLIAMSACAIIEAIGMYANNQANFAMDRSHRRYRKENFDHLIEKYGIGRGILEMLEELE